MFEILPHIFGGVFLLYALQLLGMLRSDLKNKKTGDALLALLAGVLAFVFAACAIIGADLFIPFDGTVSEAAYFIRLSILVPAAYLAAFITSQIMRRVIGSSYPQNAVSHVTYLGVTLFFLAPVAKTWFEMFVVKL